MPVSTPPSSPARAWPAKPVLAHHVDLESPGNRRHPHCALRRKHNLGWRHRTQVPVLIKNPPQTPSSLSTEGDTGSWHPGQRPAEQARENPRLQGGAPSAPGQPSTGGSRHSQPLPENTWPRGDLTSPSLGLFRFWASLSLLESYDYLTI